jgi:hypothetical protein
MDEPSNAEIMRRLDSLQVDFRDDLAEVRQAHASFVLREVYDARHAALIARVDNLEMKQTQEAEQRRVDRKFVVGAIVLPVALFVAQLVMNAQGVGA